MIKLGPPVGCIVFLDSNGGEAGIKNAFIAFEPLVEFDDRQLHNGIAFKDSPHYEQVVSSGWATLGGKTLKATVTTEKTDTANSLLLDFNEEEVIRLARAKKTAITELFMPYVEAAKVVEDAFVIAIGFDMMAPLDLREVSLYDAGAALLFMRDGNNRAWSTKSLRPMVGHYL